jgi:hypothetical protein
MAGNRKNLSIVPTCHFSRFFDHNPAGTANYKEKKCGGFRQSKKVYGVTG